MFFGITMLRIIFLYIYSEFSLLFFSPSLSAQGVQIPGLGTFTFTRQKLEVGNNKFILIQRPIFIMVEKLVQTHGLKQNKVHTPGKYISFLRLSQKVTSLGIKVKGQSLPSCCFIGFWCEELSFHVVHLAERAAKVGNYIQSSCGPF